MPAAARLLWLDNGGRFYNLFTGAGDDLVEPAELADCREPVLVCYLPEQLFKVIDPKSITDRLGLLYTTVRDKYYIDEIVNATVIKGVMLISTVFKKFDELVVDGFVLLVGRINRGLGAVSDTT